MKYFAPHIDKGRVWLHYPVTKSMPESWDERRQGNPHRYRLRVFSLALWKWRKKSPLTKSRLKSILWEGGGDRWNYSNFSLAKIIPICNTDYAFGE
jgi:hypothetical protein